jgi:hypothetical protein
MEVDPSESGPTIATAIVKAASLRFQWRRGQEGLAILKFVNISEIVYSEAPVAEDD